MKKSVFTVMLALLSLTASAQDSQTGYNFLRLPVSAHAAALGGYNVSIIEDDPSLVFSNPALLSSVTDKSVNFNIMTYMKGSTTASASYNRVIKEKASVAVMAQYMDYGTMREMDENNVQMGDFSAKDIALGGAFSYMLADKIVGGISARMVASYIGGYDSYAFGVDLGVNYYDPEKEWSVSIVAKNLGGQLKAYDDEYDKMPLDLQAGVSKTFGLLPLRLSATLVDLNHWGYKFVNHLAIGADIHLSQQLYVAAGYNFRRSNEMGVLGYDNEESSHGAGMSLGAGVSLERFKIKVAYGKYHVSSSSLMASLTYAL